MKMAGWIVAAGVASAAIPCAAHAALTEDQFQIRTAGDLVALCTADNKDPLYTAAVNYCHGFVSGAYSAERDHEASVRATPLFCVPSPPPSRSQAIGDFVLWVKADPARSDLGPIRGLFEYLLATYPCATPPTRPAHAKPKS
jgi:hypothetical protein